MYSSVANSVFKGHLCWIKWILKFTLEILKIMDVWSWSISAASVLVSHLTLYKARILSKGQEVRDQAPYWGKKLNNGIQRICEQRKPIRRLAGGGGGRACFIDFC